MVCPETLVLSITAAAITVARSLDTADIELLAAVAMQFADTLTTIVAARDTHAAD